MNKTYILFIYADDCLDCKRAKQEVQQAIDESKKSCELKLFKFDTKEAVNIAINNGIDDIPACVVGNFHYVFQSDQITKANILESILAISA
jgi:hypothetical protein